MIAIAITLLAIEIRLPHLEGDIAHELPQALLALWPRYLSFFISFLVIGSYWWAHHRTFRLIWRFDDRLIWLNILFLLCIASMPFASGVIGEYGDQPAGVILYAGLMIATVLTQTFLWRHASRGHRLLPPRRDTEDDSDGDVAGPYGAGGVSAVNPDRAVRGRPG